MTDIDPEQKGWQTLEWLQTNEHGSFALGAVDRIPRRKYHGQLISRDPATGEPFHVLADVAERVIVGDETFLLNNFDFAVDVFPAGYQHMVSFSQEPTPVWKYQLKNVKVERTLEIDHKHSVVKIAYAFSGITRPISFTLEPMLTCRGIHRITRENPFLNGGVRTEKAGISVEPYAGIPRIHMKVDGNAATFSASGRWDKGIHYLIEEERGYEANEDFFCPGTFQLEVVRDGIIVFHCGTEPLEKSTYTHSPRVRETSTLERLRNAAANYLITRADGSRSVIAGYPWYGELAREALIALPGLCLHSGREKEAEVILASYGDALVAGEIPNQPSTVETDQNMRVDVPLLYIRAVQMLGAHLGAKAVKPLMPIVYKLLSSLKHGSDDRVRVTSDGGIFIKPNPYPMTWMSVMLDAQPLTPRFGFAVELNALFFNALTFAMEWAKENHHSDFTKEWGPILEEAAPAFMSRFWSAETGFLADTFDGSAQDLSFRPNQLWALGLPFSPVPSSNARMILDKTRGELLTPVGMRTLSPRDPRYQGVCSGGPRQRDLALHQGTVFPFLLGIYADAVLKHFSIERVRAEFSPILDRLIAHLGSEGCLEQIAECFDGNAPHHARGAPASATSVGEVLRLVAMIRQD